VTRIKSVGVAGCGKIANDRHIPALQSLLNVSVDAVYDHRWTNAEHSAQRHGIENIYADVNEFVSSDFDFVTICTPPFAHKNVAVPAMETGVSVLTEKPMAVKLSDAEEMVDAADETGQALGVVHNFLYSSSVTEAKKLVRSGSIGDIQYIKGFQLSSSGRELPSWYSDLPGGLFFDESPHLLYLMEKFLGKLVIQNTEVKNTDTPRQVDSVTAAYRGEQDKIGQLSMVFNAPLSEWFLIVVGTKKILVIDIFRDILVKMKSDGTHSPIDVVRTAVSAMTQFSLGMVSSGISTLQGNLFFGFKSLASGFVQSMDENAEPPVTGEDGKRILEYIYDTVDKGRI
jgi:predicted dehydrogenase